MKDSNLKTLNRIIIAILLLLLIIVIFFKGKSYVEDSASNIESTIPEKVEVVIHTPSPVEPKKKTVIDQKFIRHYKEAIGFNDTRFQYVLNQKLLVREFKELIQLDVNLPPNMQFIRLDLEDNIAGLYGQSYNGEKKMAILATKGPVKLSDAIDYMKTSGGALPLMGNHKIDPANVDILSVPKTTGLKQLQVIPTSPVNGMITYGALAERADGKGTYLFMMEAPSAYFHQQEGSLDQMLDSVKAK